MALVEEDALDMSQPVPLLMEQMRNQQLDGAAAAGARFDAPRADTGEVQQPPLPLSGEALSTDSGLDPEGEQPTASKPVKKSRMRRLREEIQTSFFDDLDRSAEPVAKDDAPAKAKKKQSRRLAKKNAAKDEAAASVADKPAEGEAAPVLVISVAGRESLRGRPLFKLVQACGMEFGDMNIFHRHEDGPSQGPVQFSMANAVKPGIFNLSQQDDFSTPAVTFFLEMSEPRDLMNAFDCMLATAKCVADNLDGVLKDEHRSVMRPQTIEHCRQQIRDYERRRLAKRA